MPFSPEKHTGTLSGILFVALVAASATYIAALGPVKALSLSPLVVGIVIGGFLVIKKEGLSNILG